MREGEDIPVAEGSNPAGDLPRSQAFPQSFAADLIDAMQDGFSVLNADGIALAANPALCQITGFPQEELVGKGPPHPYWPPEEYSRIQEALEETLKDSGLAFELTFMRKNGQRFPAIVTAFTVMPQNGDPVCYAATVKDITELRDLSAAKSAEARLASQKVELDQALRLALISEVSAGIIHQIGQPLSAIGAHVSAFAIRYQAGEIETDDCHHFLDELAANVARMRDSVIRLKALANPEQAKRLPVNLNGLIAESLHLVQAANVTQRFEIVTAMDSDLPLLPADKVQLSQVVINLVRNAMDACVDFPPERRIIQITTRAVEGQAVELGVRDSGMGIAPSVMNRLFDPFFTTKAEGFGIGLRLSRTIVEAHGGTLEGSNNPDGIGATFRVLLPLGSKLCDTKG